MSQAGTLLLTETPRGTGLAAGPPDCELAQVQRVGLAGQAAVPGQEPGQRPPLPSENAGPAGRSAADVVVVVIGNPPRRARTSSGPGSQ